MDEQQTHEVEATETEATEEPQGTDELKEWKANARKWEKRAKENAKAAEELEQLKRSQMDDLERLTLERDEAVQELQGLKLAAQRREWVDKVSEETKVPASLLSKIQVEDIDSLRDVASSIAQQMGPKGLPVLGGDGVHPVAMTATETADNWLRKQIFNRK